MNRSLALATTMMLLCGCQPPAEPPAPPSGANDGGARMQARLASYTTESLPALDHSNAVALQSLAGTRYLEQGQELDLATVKFAVEVADFEPGAEAKLQNVVFADYLTAMAVAKEAGVRNLLPSVNVIDGLCKQVNDGVYARLELAIEANKKADLRRRLLVALREGAKAHPGDTAWQRLLVRTAASLSLAGETPELNDEQRMAFAGLSKMFAQDLMRSKPIGFYTHTPKLAGIFKADRMLQTLVPLTKGVNPDSEALKEAAAAGSVLASDADLAKLYGEVATFYQRMTNPFSAFSPAEVAAVLPEGSRGESEAERQALFAALQAARTEGKKLQFSLLPPSRSTESTLFEADPPGDGDLMGHLIKRVREGKVSLTPGDGDGFYQYQQHALAALLTPEKQPEGAKVAFGSRYLKRLEESFKTGLAKARETHAKQVDVGVGVTSVVKVVKPRLYLEPLPTVYARYAQMYAFLEDEVLPLFDAETLAEKPLYEGATRGVAEEVAATKRLMAGLAMVAAGTLGMAAPTDLPLEASEREQALAEAKAWLADLGHDARLAADTRVLVPVSVTGEGKDKRIQFWGTGGVTFTKVRVSFAAGKSGEPSDYFVTADRFVAFSRPYDKGTLSREEYRRILDGAKTWSEAIKKLEGG